MNIKQAESATGVSRRNIRFYEQEGLITPSRNRENDYREYSQSDIQVLKQIRILRMVDMPLEQIRDVLQGTKTLTDAAKIQKKRLEEKARELEKAIRFCEEFSSVEDMAALDTDAVLCRMEKPENQASLFTQWVDDYKRFAKAQMKKSFYFEPEKLINDERDMTMELFRYADQNGLDMVITKEGMRPELTINGHEYVAERVYFQMRGFPLPMIQCDAVHPEEFELTEVSAERKAKLKWLWILLPHLCSALVFLLAFSSILVYWEGWLLFGILVFFVPFYLRRYGWYGVRFRMKHKDTPK